VPWFEGERTPNLPRAQASLTGLTLASTNRANFARAAIEGMLSGLAVGLEAIQAQGVDVRRILLIGGAAANEGVARIAAQVFDAEIVVPAAGEYVALGAARQAAGVLAGGPVDWSVATTRAVDTDHRPQIRERYDVVAALRAAE
jgi:xylulokinase